LDRVLVSEAKGHRFESCRARQFSASRAPRGRGPEAGGPGGRRAAAVVRSSWSRPASQRPCFTFPARKFVRREAWKGRRKSPRRQTRCPGAHLPTQRTGREAFRRHETVIFGSRLSRRRWRIRGGPVAWTVLHQLFWPGAPVSVVL